MKQKSLANWLKFIIIGVGVCGLLVYALIFSALMDSVIDMYPEFTYCKVPWLVFLWLTAIPCYGVLILGWKVASNIGADRTFCMENAKCFQWVSALAVGDCLFFFAGNIVLWLLNMNHPGVICLALIVIFFGIAVAVAAAVLSRLVRKAADLQEESDLTI